MALLDVGGGVQAFGEIGTHGFRFFRIVQVGSNSSGSNNLALSNLELYGKTTKGNWP